MSLDPINEIVYFIEGLFHSDYYDETKEQQKTCKYCDIKYYSHNDLIHHILKKHPKELLVYQSTIDEIIRNPIKYLYASPSWADLMNDPELIETCAFCGEEIIGSLKVQRHFQEEHKEEFNRMKKLMKEIKYERE